MYNFSFTKVMHAKGNTNEESPKIVRNSYFFFKGLIFIWNKAVQINTEILKLVPCKKKNIENNNS